MPVKNCIVLVQLGSPKSSSVADVRSYLRQFLADPRVVDLNPILWKIILNLFVLPFRPFQSAKAYSRLKDERGFPLIYITEDFAKNLNKINAKKVDFISVEFEYRHAFILSKPKLGEEIQNLAREINRDRGGLNFENILLVPLFPQYSESTTAAVFDVFAKALGRCVYVPQFTFLNQFFRAKCFIDGSARLIDTAYQKSLQNKTPFDRIYLSFHGIPKRRVIVKKDPYYDQCFKTMEYIKANLKRTPVDLIVLCFQSRFGNEEWLMPYTSEILCSGVEQNYKNIGVYCPSFVADCLETIDEIGSELGAQVKKCGGKLTIISCLNTEPRWITEFDQFIKEKIKNPLGVNTSVEYFRQEIEEMAIPEVKLAQKPLDKEAKSTLKIMFLTLFLDLVGFSIIFPLFPALAKYYLEVEQSNYFLNLIFGTLTNFLKIGGASYTESLVLFGGALGALYSFLQFIAAPIWGVISDRVGRRPVLLISIFGLALSYLLWFFAGNFTWIVLARFIGGIMGGNISTATAVVADVTDSSNRSKGMATIGIAFALGFVLGPALGGLSSMLDLTVFMPWLKNYGVNPFSVPALIAFILSVINLVLVKTKFKETLKFKNVQSKQNGSRPKRMINPFKLFAPLPYEGVNQANMGYFLFLLAFSGMEFTLTFLAVERLAYSSLQNGYMFIFIGVIIAVVQGGFVRRKAHSIGEKKMTLIGLILLIPGLLSICFAKGSFLLYVGLFLLSWGSAMVIPCLTALVSLYTPLEEQGKSIGIFRSLGALARVIGPIIASFIYWKYGASYPYSIGSIFLIIPIIMVALLPKPKY